MLGAGVGTGLRPSLKRAVTAGMDCARRAPDRAWLVPRTHPACGHSSSFWWTKCSSPPGMWLPESWQVIHWSMEGPGGAR